MDCYFIEITNIPKDKIHAGLRSFRGFDEPETYTLFLSTTGRLSNKPSKRANLDTLNLAETFLEFWQPRLETRGWGDFQCYIRKEKADKWREKQLPISSVSTRTFLNEHADNTIKESSKIQGKLIIAVDGVSSGSFSNKEGYWSRHKKLGWGIASNMAGAKRYKSATSCLKIIKQHLSGPNTKFRARIHELTLEEIRLIQKQKNEHWDFVFCRNQ